MISALNHISASCLFLSTDITLPYKPPTSTAPLLESLLGSTGGLNSCPSPINSLRHVFLVENSINQVEKPIFKSTIDYDQLISANHGRQLPNQGHLRNSDIATIQFTSGTTSAPKAACLSHKSILNNGFLVGRGMDLTERDIVCCPPPLYHCFGLVLGLLAVMTHGICSSFYKCPTHSLKKIFDCEQRYQVLTVRKEHASYCHRKHLTQERSLDQSKTIDQPPSMVSRQCFSPSWNCFPKGYFTSTHLMFIH